MSKTIDILTMNRKQYGNQTVLVLYGGPNETHEAAFAGQSTPTVVEGGGVTFGSQNNAVVANWAATPDRKVLQFPSGLYVYLLGKNHSTSLPGYLRLLKES